MSQHTALARSWRPSSLSEVVGQDLTVTALDNALASNTLHHAYLFTGTRGVGKTSLARILAKSMNCQAGISPKACGECPSCIGISEGNSVDVIEIDAASRTKVEDTRELLEQTQFHPVNGRFKIFIIDEVHMLSGHSFNALLKTLEEPPGHVKFLLATTELEKVPATVRSRCIHFPLENVSQQTTIDYIAQRLDGLAIKYETAALEMLAIKSAGSMRDALTLLEHLLLINPKELTTAATASLLGRVSDNQLLELLRTCYQNDSAQLRTLLENYRKKAIKYRELIKQMTELVHSESLKSLYDTKSEFDPEFLQVAYDILTKAMASSAWVADDRIHFEMNMLRMSLFAPASDDAPIQKNNTHAVTSQSTLNHESWLQLVPTLDLKGMSMALAKELVLLAHANDTARFSLPPKLKSLMTNSATAAICASLKNHGIQNIDIQLEENEQLSFHANEKKNKSTTEGDLKAALGSHPKTSALLKALRADIDSLVIETSS